MNRNTQMSHVVNEMVIKKKHTQIIREKNLCNTTQITHEFARMKNLQEETKN